MAKSPHRRHGNFPQRRTRLLSRVAKYGAQYAPEITLSRADPHLASIKEELNLPAEHLNSSKLKMEPNWYSKRRPRFLSPTEKRQRHPDKDITAALKRIRVHPEAKRILGNSCIAMVSLERLNFQRVSLSCLQPVVSLVRLPCQIRTEQHSEVDSLVHPHQNGLSQITDILGNIPGSPQSKPPQSFELKQPDTPTSSCVETCLPEVILAGVQEPEQDISSDCESNPDQPYVVFGSEEWDQDGKNEFETFYLDPDAEQTIFIKLDPELGLDQDRPLKLEDESDTKCEVDTVGEQSEYSCLPALQESFSTDQVTEGMESEDFCGVCLNGGDLLCCDRCPKVFHLLCHVPPLSRFPLGDWVCTLCRTDQDPAESYDCENMHHHGGVKAPYTLSHQDQRRCEKLTLLLLCHAVSSPFHEPVSPLAQNYYQIIKKPIDLSVIRRKLDKSNTLHYFTVEQFVDDVLLMFKNCDTFNYPDSEVAQAGRNLEAFFLSKLKEIFPDQTFPSVSQEKMDRARRRWLNRKKKESYRKKRYIFSGKKYCL